jgi:hypothetical protein
VWIWCSGRAEVVEGAEKIDIVDSLVLSYGLVDACSCEIVLISVLGIYVL